MKKILTAIVLILCFIQRDVYAQNSVLQLLSVPAQPVPAGAAITINGTGFSKDLSQISIRVGAGSLCKPLLLSDAGDGTQNLLIQLAPQATNDYLYVTQNGLVVTSSNRVNVVSGCNQTTNLSSSSFSPPAALATAGPDENISCVAIGDLNNDGQMDVVSPRDSHTGLATGKRMAINYGGGKEDSFSTRGDVTSIQLADMNGDGRLDILTTELIFPADTTLEDSTLVAIYPYNPSTSGFGPGVVMSLKTRTKSNQSNERVIPIDLDHDGQLDVVEVSADVVPFCYPPGVTLINDDPLHQQGEVVIFKNEWPEFSAASATFLTNASDSLVEPGDTSLSVSDLNLGIGDFNGDGLPDIAVYHAINSKGTGGNNGRVAQVSYSQPCDGKNACLDPSFEIKAKSEVTIRPQRIEWSRAMATGDIDGDGFDDIVLCGGDSAFILSGRQLDCNCSEEETTIDLSTFLHQGGGAAACTLTDINSDGKLDIAFLSEPDSSGSKGSSLTYFQNTSSAKGITGNLISEDWTVPDSIADFTAADMDGDGKPDLVFASSETGGTISLSKNAQACGDAVSLCDPGCFHSSNNVVINGNFNSIVKNQSYTATKSYSLSAFSDKSAPGFYLIDNVIPASQSSWCGTDHTSGSGNMMMQNGYSGSKTSAWGQIVPVLPNTNYTFSAYVNNLTCSSKNYSDPLIELHVNGKVVSPSLTLSEKPDQWLLISGKWFSGSNPGPTATIEIVDKSTANKGNDFAIDDIQFYGCLPNLIANAGADVSICKNSSVQLSAKGSSSSDTSFTYSWSPAAGLNATDIANPVASPSKTTTYTVTISNASACSQSDAVKVTVNQNPAPKITALGSLSVCVPQCASLTANTGSGLSYQWLLNGLNAPGNNTSANYQACSSGSYQVLESTSNGCAKTSNALQVTVNNCREESVINTSSLLLYPNPTSDKVTVSFTSENEAIATLRLCDLSGKVLLQEQIQLIAGSNTQTISTKDLAGGIYIVSIATETKMVNSKLIKQ